MFGLENNNLVVPIHLWLSRGCVGVAVAVDSHVTQGGSKLFQFMSGAGSCGVRGHYLTEEERAGWGGVWVNVKVFIISTYTSVDVCISLSTSIIGGDQQRYQMMHGRNSPEIVRLSKTKWKSSSGMFF